MSTGFKYEMETVREIWNGIDGDHFEVGPDRDGLGLVEIRLRLDDGKIGTRMSISSEGAKLLAAAILACAEDLSKKP